MTRVPFALALLIVLSSVRRFSDEQFILQSIVGVPNAGAAWEQPPSENGPFDDDMFVLGEARLGHKMAERPAVVHRAPFHLRGEFVADVVSIGSQTRVEYVHAQIDTWASHVGVRHVWGFTEAQDFDVNCSSAANATAVAEYLQLCRSSHDGWDAEIDTFVTNRFAQTDRGLRQDAGWLCAQRRVGRALGWVHSQYHGKEPAALPDVLIVIDDDTVVDMGNVIEFMNRVAERKGDPFACAGCYYPRTDRRDMAVDGFPFAIPHGGFGTFFGKHAIRKLVQPIFCNGGGHGSENDNVCSALKENRAGEQAAFREGISILELFYRYSAMRSFCFHSDWVVGYMAGFYLHAGGTPTEQQPGGDAILRMNPPGPCANFTGEVVIPCTDRHSSCHSQTPGGMEHLARSFFMRFPGRFSKVPRLEESEPERRQLT